MKTARTLTFAGLIVATLALVFVAGYATRWLFSRSAPGGNTQAPGLASAAAATSQAPEFGVFWEAWDILQRDFYGGIQGLTQAYDDPYTVFVEPEPRQREKETLSGAFGGIGAWITEDEAGNMLLDPMPDRPAEKAGILKGDVLLAVDGATLAPELTADAVVDLIRGPIGEPVELTVQRAGVTDPMDFAVLRERIETPSVEWRVLEQTPQVGYIAIRQFTERTAKELDRAVDELNQQGISYLVVDLRHNGGGLLESSIDVASRFLSDGVVLYERHNDGGEQTYRVRSAQRAPNWPMVVLVDGATASASEIVAGALQDRGRATLLGEKTYGKGSVQLVYDLSDGSSVHVTVARWLTPNGHEINGVGLTPEQVVPHDDTRDAPLQEAIRYLTELQERPG